MKSIHTQSRTGADGTLSLSLPCGMPDTEVDVLVVVQPSGRNGLQPIGDPDEWKRRLRETAGSIQDPSFVRHDQGVFERRIDW